MPGPFIFTHSGNRFSFNTPDPASIQIEDIAAALSKLCRFTGHVRRFYSVAEHCVHVSRIVPLDRAFEGLMHDAREAYIGDMSSPLKACLPEYRRLDALAHAAIAAKYQLPFRSTHEVETADLAMLKHEAQKLLACDVQEFTLPPDLPQLTVKLKCWAPDEAYQHFMDRFNELTKVRWQ